MNERVKVPGHTSRENRPRRRISPYPFLLVILVLFCILFFVAYPVERIFMRGQLNASSRNAPFPVSGTVGYLKADNGYVIFASPSLKTLVLWKKRIGDPIRQREARSFLDDGRIVILPKNTLAMSVAPLNGSVQILSGFMFGKTLYIWKKHVRFMTLNK